MNTSNSRHIGVRITVFYALLIVFVLIYISPLLWMFTSAIKNPSDIFALPPKIFFMPHFGSFVQVFKDQPFHINMLNSFIVSFFATALGLALGLPAAFSIARYRINWLLYIILAARIMPGIGYLVPMFIMFNSLHMIGTFPALIIGHLVLTLPLVVWVMVSFFEGIPNEFYDAAKIDGCSEIGAFARVAVPLAAPGVATVAILSFIFSWNDFRFALILSSAETRTLPVAIFRFLGMYAVNWSELMAAAVVIVLPVILMTFFIQKHITTGLMVGGIKG